MRLICAGTTSISGALKYDEVSNFLKHSDYCMIPSKSDALNMVGVESLMIGTPILISRNAGLADFVADKKQGLLFDFDQNAIFEIFSALEKITAQHHEMQRQARLLYIEKFAMQTYFEIMTPLFS